MEEPSYFTSVEYLVRRPLGAAALEASYYEGPEHVEEPSECPLPLIKRLTEQQHGQQPKTRRAALLLLYCCFTDR